MSYIIRLQNLPRTAKSEEIRRFFGGLCIPKGGIYIIADENRDAFILFTSDEDARLAMQKDGQMIMDAQVKLYFSSHVEMQHELGRFAKLIPDIFLPRPPVGWQRPSRNLLVERGTNHSLGRESRGYSPHSRSSHLPRMRSRSPRSSPSRFYRSPDDEWNPQEAFDFQRDEFSRRKELALFEQKIAETLATGMISMRNVQDAYHSPNTAYNSDLNRQTGMVGNFFLNLESNLMPYKSGFHEINRQDSNHLLMSNIACSSNMSTTESFVPNASSLTHAMSLPPFMNKLPLLNVASSIPVSLMSPANTPMFSTSLPPEKNLWIVKLSGLYEGICFTKVRDMLSGTFVTKENFVQERDEFGKRTQNCYVKFCNREDFKEILKHSSYFCRKRRITVSKCPENVISKYFVTCFKDIYPDPRIGLYYVKIKGLPRSVTQYHVLNFFKGLKVVDLYIAYKKKIKHRAKGIAFIAFGHWDDFEKALLKNGELFLKTNQTIHLMKSDKTEMLFVKKQNKDLLSQSTYFIPDYTNPDDLTLPDLPNIEPLCALVTGLPKRFITKRKITNFFKDNGSMASVISCNPRGRAFLTFDTLSSFEAACQCHGSLFRENVICVKEVSHEEMFKSLSPFEQHTHIKNMPRYARTSKLKFSTEKNYKKDNSLNLSPVLPFENDLMENAKDLGANLEAKIKIEAIDKSAEVENALGSIMKEAQVEETLMCDTSSTLS